MPLPPYQSRPYDYGPTSRLSDLIRQRGRVGAEAELRNAAIRSRMAQDLAGVANQTLSSLAKYQEDAPRREAQTLALEEARARQTERKQQTSLNEAFNGTLARFTTKDPETGGLAVKWDEVEAAFAQSPNAAELVPRLHQYRAGLAASAKTIRDNEQALARDRALIYGQVAEAMETMGGDKDPSSFALGLAALREQNVITDDQMTSMWKQVEDYAKGDPDRAAEAITRVVQAAKAGAAPYQPAPKLMERDPYKSLVNPSTGEEISPAQPKPVAPVIRPVGDRTQLVEFNPDGTKKVLATGPLYGTRPEPTAPAGPDPLSPSNRITAETYRDTETQKAKAAYQDTLVSLGFVNGRPPEGMTNDLAKVALDAQKAMEQRVAEVNQTYQEMKGGGASVAAPPPAPPRPPVPPAPPPAPDERRARALLDAYRRERDPGRKAALAQELRALRAQVR